MSVNPIFRASKATFPGFGTPFSFEITQNAKAVVYGSHKRELLNIIAGKVPDPSKRITFPSFGHDLWPSQAIQFVSFGQTSSASSQAPFVGARYEAFRDEFDLSLRTVLQSKAPQGTDAAEIARIAESLDLTDYLDNWYVGLSNGQSRRAQLALAFLRKPKMLVMDEPFLGLDPANREKFGDILSRLPIPAVLGLRGGDAAPAWATQFLYASDAGVTEGPEAVELIQQQAHILRDLRNRRHERAQEGIRTQDLPKSGTPTVDIRDVSIKFPNASRPLFSDLNLSIHDGERVHIKGPNGSGKSTLLALITADHPKCWSSNISLMGERLKVGKHSYFTINKLIGYSSPEIHAIFPKHLNAAKAISTGFSGNMQPLKNLSAEQSHQLNEIASKLEVNIQDEKTKFGEMSLGQQKMILLARALVKQPRILILDEAFSTLSTRHMELAFDALDGFNGAVLIVGHVEDEIPPVDKILELGSNGH